MLNLLKNKTFLLFFFGNVMSLLGFGFNLIAISWMVLEKKGSEYTLCKIMGSATAPGLSLALFAGAGAFFFGSLVTAVQRGMKEEGWFGGKKKDEDPS